MLAAAWALNAAAGAALAGGPLSPEAAHQMAARGRVALIDVRSPREWRQTGIALGARAVTIHNPDGAGAFAREVLRVLGGDRSRPVALICAAGVRSARARRILESNGFTDVYDVSAGMSGTAHRSGWIARGLPVRPCAGRNAC